ncbi:MAG TPA: ABC transporter permease, partial [Bacillota bacterium]|nr:ABC transporter permease [Bacillota bacterium]
IARALANNPSIILADEPTGALDKESEEVILAILKKVVESGKLVIVVTHSEVVANHCNRIVRIADGVIVEDVERYKIKKSGQFEKTIMPKPIKTKDIAKISMNNIKQKLSRSLIVSIGLSLGIAAMVLILNLGSGLTNYVQEVFADNLQTTQLSLTKASYDEFTDDDISQISSVEGIQSIYESTTILTADYLYGDTTDDISHLSAYYDNYYPNVLYGTLSTDTGSIAINETMAGLLSDDALIASIGSTIDVIYDSTTYTFTITAIYEDLSENADEANMLIYGDDLTNLFSDDEMSVNTIYLNLESVDYINVVIDDLDTLGFNVYQEDNSANSVLSYIEIGTKILTGVSAISMVVAAIMIFIVLYISIVERTKEIGILRAIGTRKKDISKMFIFEAGIIGFSGGLFGVLFAIGISLFTNTITGISLGTTLISYNAIYYVFGVVVSFLVSVIAGIAPAVKAADLDPVVSLRFE